MQECCKWDWIEIGKNSIEVFFNFLLEGFWDHSDSVAIVEQGGRFWSDVVIVLMSINVHPGVFSPGAMW